MKRSLKFLALTAWLTACAASADLAAGGVSGGGSSSSSAGGKGSSGEDAGAIGNGGTSGGAHSGSSSAYSSVGGGTTGGAAGSGSGSSSGGSTPGCNPAGPTPCETGLVCDQATQSCRLPGYGESCTPDAGCAPEPPGMICSDASYAGSSQELCLVPCSTSTGSSACPYGMSCGDPDLPGYCSPEGAGTCTPWAPCSLGANLIGVCVPTTEGVSCVAAGTVTAPFTSCNPQASNSDATDLCANGMICVAAADVPQTLGSAPAEGAGYCVPPCAGSGLGATGAPSCGDGEHCYQAAGASYGLCLPGSPCSLNGSKACQYGWWCLPDSFDAESGGCIDSAADAGAAGAPCDQPAGFTITNPCQAGNVCLADASGGTSCETVCIVTPTAEVGNACTCSAVDDAGVLGLCEPDAG